MAGNTSNEIIVIGAGMPLCIFLLPVLTSSR